MQQTPGSQFLHEKNPNLHFSQEVEGVVYYLRAGDEAIANEPADKINAYLGFLANKDYVNDGILTGDPESVQRQVSAAVIDVNPETANAYYKFQSKIAREQGVTLDPD